MNELESLKVRLQEINNKRIRLQTIIEQANQQCKEIEAKYNISNEEEFKQLMDKTEEQYRQKVEQATMYLLDTEQALKPYEGLM